jgi:hypothetical protein
MVTFLTGFAASAPSPAFRVTDRLEVTRFFIIDPTFNHMSPGAWVVNDTAARQVEQALIALPLPPDGVRFCPIDYGVRYRLAFFYKGSEVLQVIADAGDCLEAHSSELGARQTDYAFWVLLGRVLNLPVEGGIFLSPQP